MTASNNTPTTDVVIPDIATRINEAHAAATKSASSAIEFARRAGELLAEAKAAIPHGDWIKWLESNVTVGSRMAQQYMRLARELPKLDHEKAKRVSHLPIRYAVRQLATAAPKLAVMNAAEIERVVAASDDGEPLARATYEVKRERAKEDRQRESARRVSESQRSGEIKIYDIWATQRELVTRRAVDVECHEYGSAALLEEAGRIIPRVPDDSFVPQSARDEANALRKLALAELKRRCTELEEWAQEQCEVISRPLWSMIDEVSEAPILIGRKRGDHSVVSDASMFGFVFGASDIWETPHDPDSCACGGAKPAGCP